MKDALGHGSSGGHSTGIRATPKLQRRHFEAIASELRSQPDAGSDDHRARVNAVADQLATTNPGFRRDFFTAAAIPGAGSYNNKSDQSAADLRKVAKFKAGKL